MSSFRSSSTERCPASGACTTVFTGSSLRSRRSKPPPKQAPVSVAESRTVAVVTLPAEDGEPRRGRRNGRGRESSVDSFLRHRQPLDVRLVLPGGARLEFTSESPELLAMAMLQSAGGPT